MGRSSKKPRQKKLDPLRYEAGKEANAKKEKDWSFEDILRSKTRRR